MSVGRTDRRIRGMTKTAKRHQSASGLAIAGALTREELARFVDAGRGRATISVLRVKFRVASVWHEPLNEHCVAAAVTLEPLQTYFKMSDWSGHPIEGYEG
jgi:hypothetical protein